LLRNRYREYQRFVGRVGAAVTTRRARVGKNEVEEPANRSLLELTRESARSDPLTELGLADAVDVNPDATEVAFVDLHLVQVRGGMGVSGR
jgi:hypothetical protein